MRDDILALVVEDLAAGTESLRTTVRRLVTTARPELAARLDARSDAFLEPFAFRHFATGTPPEHLDEILGGYVAQTGQPVCLRPKLTESGRCYLPGFGYIIAPALEGPLEVVISAGRDAPQIIQPHPGYPPLPFAFEPLAFIAGTNIELLRHGVPMLADGLCTEQGERVSIDLERAVARFGAKLEVAFSILRAAWPELFATFNRFVRRIVLFESESLNSFADPSFHGIAFSNVTLGRDEVFLVEDLAHQCGHVVFFAATQDPAEYFLVPPSVEIGTLIDRDDRRSLYVVLHGLVTEAFMAVCLDECLSRDLVASEQRQELEGRLGFITQRFGEDANNLCRPGILSSKGERLASALLRVLRDVIDRRRAFLLTADFSNQVYNFDFARYLERNAPTGQTAASRRRAVRPVREDSTMTQFSFEGVSRLGFGGYRVVPGNSNHVAALSSALDLGCTLVDTAPNYGDGQSEELMGSVLTRHPRGADVFVVTKVGYVSASTAAILHNAGIDIERLDSISEESRYSLATDVIRAKLEVSRKRLRRDRLDAVLLHNPEHYFEREGSYDRRRNTLRSAFELLEEQVADGRLGCYGVSSNTLATPGSMPIEEWVAVARSVNSNHRFCVVEFPFNLLETEATVEADGQSLLDRIRGLGLRTIGNRPLSSQRPEGPVRLATSSGAQEDADDDGVYATCVELVRERLVHGGLSHTPMDFMVMQFLRDNRRGIAHPELVDAIFARHVYPFVEHLWDEPDAKAPREFATLHAILRHRAVGKLDERANQIRAELTERRVIDSADSRPLALIACEFGLRSGLDHVIVGMRSPAHVDVLRPLFGELDHRRRLFEQPRAITGVCQPI